MSIMAKHEFDYYGLFVSDTDKVRMLPTIHIFDNEKKYLDHVTLLHWSQMGKVGADEVKHICDNNIGNKYKVEIQTIGYTPNNDVCAYGVELFGMVSMNEQPHITIATTQNGKPFMSNLIEEWKLLDEPIELWCELRKITH